MMSDEIKNLYQRFDERNEQRQLGRINSTKEDEHIANLSTSAGWEVLKSKAESMIIELLEPVEFSDETPLDVRGAINEARRFGIKVLRTLIGQVESVRSSETIKKQEESKPEA